VFFSPYPITADIPQCSKIPGELKEKPKDQPCITISVISPVRLPRIQLFTTARGHLIRRPSSRGEVIHSDYNYD